MWVTLQTPMLYLGFNQMSNNDVERISCCLNRTEKLWLVNCGLTHPAIQALANGVRLLERQVLRGSNLLRTKYKLFSLFILRYWAKSLLQNYVRDDTNLWSVLHFILPTIILCEIRCSYNSYILITTPLETRELLRFANVWTRLLCWTSTIVL